MLRPLRVGLLLRSNPTSLHRGIEWATSTWGGAYTLLLDPTGEEGLLRVADGLGVDVLYPVNDDERERKLAETPGYAAGRDEAKRRDTRTLRSICRHDCSAPSGCSIGYRKASSRSSRPGLTMIPSVGILSVWLGKYGADDYGRQLAAAVEQHGRVVDLAPDAPVPSRTASLRSRPTGREIGYSGENGFHGFVVVDPTNPIHLRLAWNVRALGATYFRGR